MFLFVFKFVDWSSEGKGESVIVVEAVVCSSVLSVAGEEGGD
jgi:hypothetical protein